MKEKQTEVSMTKKDGTPPAEEREPKIPMSKEEALAAAHQFSEELLAEKEPKPAAASEPAPPLTVASVPDHTALASPERNPSPELEPGEFKLPKPDEGAFLYRFADGSVHRVFCVRSETGKKKMKMFFIQPTGSTATAERITQAELSKRGAEEGWEFVGIDTIKGPIMPEPEMSLALEQAIAKMISHLSLLRPGEKLYYTDAAGVARTIERSSAKEMYSVTAPEQVDGETVHYPIGRLAEVIESEGWRFRGKERLPQANSVEDSKPAVGPAEPGIESAKEIEHRLMKLRDGRVLEYLDAEGRMITIVGTRNKNQEFQEVNYPGNTDDDYPVNSLNHTYPQNLGDTKVFNLLRGSIDDAETKPYESITLAPLVARIQAEKWKFQKNRMGAKQEAAPSPVPSEAPVEPAAPEAETEVLTLSIGETAIFEKTVASGGESLRQKVERTAGGYYLFTEDGTRDPFPLSEQDFQRLFQGWKRSLEQAEAEATPETASEAAPKVSSPEDEAFRAALDAEVAKLRQEVDLERTAYVTKELEQSGAWNKLSKLFRIKKRDGDDEEVERFKEFYTSKLFEWKNAELERLRHLGLGRNELRQEMAVLVREFEFEEAERLYDERIRKRVEKLSVPHWERMKELWEETRDSVVKTKKGVEPVTGWKTEREVLSRDWLKFMVEGSTIAGQATLAGVEKVGTTYNKVMKGRAGKYIMGASLIGTGALVFGTGGTAIAGVLIAKRLAAGAAFAVTADKVMNDYVESNRAIKEAGYLERKEVGKMLDQVAYDNNSTELSGPAFVDLRSLDEYLEKEGIGKVHDKVKSRQRSKVFRKGGAILAGAAVGGLIPREWFDLAIGSSAHAASMSVGEAASDSGVTVADLRDVPSPENGAGVPGAGPAASLESSGTGVLAQGTGADHIASTTSLLTLESRMNELASMHMVKPGESIWKIAEKSVEGVSDMDKRSTTRFAKLLELKLEEKLAVIDPKLAEAAGFTVDAEGRFTPDHIQAGAKLELGRLLSAEEMAQLVEEAKGDSPITLATAHPQLPVVTDSAPLASVEVGSVEPTETERIAIEEARIDAAVPVPSADERAEVLGKFNMSTELVGSKGDVMRYVGTLSREEQEHLFRNFRRITTELFQTNEVMGGEVYDVNYDRIKNPLHGSQMEAVMKFSKAAAKVFGQSMVEPRATESIQEYVLRMVAIADSAKVKIPGFRMLN